MNRLTLSVAAVAAGVLAAAAFDAQAARRPAPQSFQYKVGRKLYKDNNPARSELDIFQYHAGVIPFLNFSAANIKVGIGGSTQNLASGSILGFPDPRTMTFPATFTSAEPSQGLTFLYSAISGSLPKAISLPKPKPSLNNSWHEDTGVKFSMKFTSYNATTGRLAGTFSGTLIAGDSNDSKHQKNVKLTSGKFSAEVTFVQ